MRPSGATANESMVRSARSLRIVPVSIVSFVKGTEPIERKSDADRALSIIEGQMMRGEWTDPEGGKVKLADYAESWITDRYRLSMYSDLGRGHIEVQCLNDEVRHLSLQGGAICRRRRLSNGRRVVWHTVKASMRVF